jgi:hypothetical protein
MDPWTLAERGLPVAAAERLIGVRPCGHSGGWVLTESGEKGEELRGVLTEGFGGRFDGEARLAAVKGERQR